MMPAMPPMQVSASSSASAKSGDGNFGGSTVQMQSGDWNISHGGGGVTTSSTMPMLMIAAAAAGAWWLARRKA